MGPGAGRAASRGDDAQNSDRSGPTRTYISCKASWLGKCLPTDMLVEERARGDVTQMVYDKLAGQIKPVDPDGRSWTSRAGMPWVNDKFTHCWAACTSRRACGLLSQWSATGMMALILKEFGDTLAPEHCFDLVDLEADLYGDLSAWALWDSCDSLCEQGWGSRSAAFPQGPCLNRL